MSIRVTDFKWEKGKNDLEYIALLERNLDVMMDKFRECSKVAREQYNKGKEDGKVEAYEHCYDAITYADTANECRQIIYDLF